LDIIISNGSHRPIYEQIYTQLKNQIIAGALEEGDALPSIRALAKDLKISVITTKRAYEELEREGFIYTIAGKGCFVAEQSAELVRESQLRQIETRMEEILELGASCGLTCEDLVQMLRMMAEEE